MRDLFDVLTLQNSWLRLAYMRDNTSFLSCNVGRVAKTLKILSILCC